MVCNVYGNNLPESVQNVIKTIEPTSSIQQDVLASIVKSKEFKEYYEALVQREFPKDLNFVGQDIGSLTKVLKDFYISKKGNISVTATQEQGRITKGFSNEQALIVAQTYMAKLILERYYDNINLPKKEQLSSEELLQDIIDFVTSKLFEIYAPNVYSQNKDSQEAKEFIPVLTDYNTKKALYDDYIRDYNRLIVEKKQTKDENRVSEINTRLTEIKTEINSLENELLKLKDNLYLASVNLITSDKKSVKENNYLNLVSLLRSNPNSWFKDVFTSKLLTDVTKEFNPVIGNIQTAEEVLANIESAEETDEENEIHNEAINTGWDREIKDAMKAIDASLRIYLNSLPKLADNEKLSDGQYNYDTDNELGVNLNSDANILMGHLMIGSSFYSVDAFIQSVRNLSNKTGLHSLVIMADRMESDREFANFCYCQLNKPAIKKCIINVIEGNLYLNRSNTNIDSVIQKTWDIVNVYKLNHQNAIDPDDIENIDSAIATLINRRKLNTDTTIADREVKKAFKLIKELVKRHFPNFNEEEIDNAIYNKLNTPAENCIEFLKLLKEYINEANSINATLIQNDNAFKKEWYNYQESRKLGDVGDLEVPKNKTTSETYNGIYRPAKSIAEFMSRNNISKLDLNSTNAAGNMSSDMIANSYITQLLSQVQDSFKNKNNELAYRQLNKLKDIIKDKVYYKYSEIFFGVPGVKDGLFIRNNNGEIKVNPKANEVIDLYLFDGLRDRANNTNALYSNMFEGDYFMCLLAMYANESNINKEAYHDNLGGFMLRVPSDAGKNFIALAQKISIEGLLSVNKASLDLYAEDVRQELIETLLTNSSKDKKSIKFIHSSEDKNFNTIDDFSIDHFLSSEELYELITEGTIGGSKKFNRKLKDPGIQSFETRFVWESGKDSIEVVVALDKVDTNQYNNLKVKKIITNNKEDGQPSLPKSLFKDLTSTLEKKGIAEGSVTQDVNSKHNFIKSFRQQVLGEINLLVSQLHMLFEEKEIERNGVVEKLYVLKSDSTGLFDFMHYSDGKQKEKADKFLDENGELIGNAFKFFKLFDIGDFKASDEIKTALSLYGRANENPLFIKDDEFGLRLNTKRTDLITNNNGRFEFVESKELLNKLSDIVTNWLQKYIYSIDVNTLKYEAVNDGKYSQDLIRECMINYALVYMSFDDILEGNTKFYKDAETLLKRAKEVQMAGTAFSNVNYEDLTKGSPKPLLSNGNPVTFTVAGKTYEAKDGFDAVTVYNTLAASENADAIERDTYRSLIAKGISEKVADKIAKAIANPFRSKTKYNDAQSYITFDEWVRRRHADGTLHKYTDIIEQIMDPNIPIEKIDVEDSINRIQVDKNVYYDLQYDEISGLDYPRQIKNAEFVLIPKFLPEGSPLRELHDIMVRNEIGQLNTIETSKAANRNVLTYFSIKDGSVTPEAISQFENDIISKRVKEHYYYRYLYKQQEVPQHFEDAKNKVGIQFVKKLIDNYHTGSPELQEAVNELIEQYCYNIQESFNEFLDDMGWALNEKGEVVNKDGSTKLNKDEYYRRVAQEAQRLGVDSNFMDYVTLDEYGNPKMPNFMNLISTKFENIIQSVFNNYITRQTIAGWHGAQITNVGYHKDLKYHPEVYFKNGTTSNPISKEEYEKLSKEEQENYYQAAYAEVMIPRWSKLIPKDYPIEKLSQDGLDLQLGYRVPTEGKQSITILKVVGFLDDSQGSTIMVPNDWVTQTGADFDIDSIYGVCHHVRRTKDGRIVMVQYDANSSDEAVLHRYNAYIKRAIKIKYDRVTNEDFHERITELREKFNDESPVGLLKTEIQSLVNITSEILEQYPEEKVTKGGDTITKYIKKFTRSKKGLLFNEVNDALIGKLTTLAGRKSVSEEAKTLLNRHIDVLRAINDIYVQFNTPTLAEANREYYKEQYSGVRKELIESAKNNYQNEIFAAARELGLKSLDEFKKLPISLQNSREARDNVIVQNMFKIMNDISSREENFSRSNFDDILDAKRNYEILLGTDKAKRSAYNPMDQLQFYVNAMATRQLKARSVIRDNFLSLCNKGKIIVNDTNAIEVTYDLTQTYIDENGNEQLVYDIEIIRECYGENIVKEENGFVTIKHNKLGWSNTNRNITGKLLTAYSSQTTAHILDAIKEGSLLNENTYTFAAFKTLVDLGIDYFTALNFLSQNGITEVVKANNEISSVLQSHTAYPINMAIKRILRDAGFKISEYAKNNQISEFLLSSLEFTDKLKEIYGEDIEDINLYNLPLKFNGKSLINNHKNNNWAFDVVTVLQFGKLLKLGEVIESNAKCSNPDKFGAKQSIYETRRIRDKINQLRSNTVLTTEEGVPFIEALYPVDENGQIDIEKSFYGYIAAFLKYSTLPSIQINSQIFELESDKFDKLNNTLNLSIGRELTKEQHKRFNKYLVNYIFNNVPYLQLPITIDSNGFVGIDMSRVSKNQNEQDIVDAERFRIHGFGLDNGYLNIINFNHPSQSEIDEFNKLSPVEKVILIQQNLNDSGIFSLLQIQTVDDKNASIKGKSSYLKFTDSSENIETLYKLFRESFSNKNPLIRLAAIDLIKYAFVVEGFDFKRGNISKLIVNSALRNRIEDGGLNIIQVAIENFTDLRENTLNTNDLVNRFVRANSDVVKKVKINKPEEIYIEKEQKGKKKKSKKKETVNDYKYQFSLLFDKKLKNDYFAIANNKENEELLRALEVIQEESEISPLQYINLTRWDATKKAYKTVLYRIIYDNGVFGFVPLNKLEPFETSRYSINDFNNIFAREEYFTAEFNRLQKTNTTTKAIVNKEEEKPIKDIKSNTDILNNSHGLNTLLNTTDADLRGGAEKLYKAIQDYISSPVEGRPSFAVTFNINTKLAKLNIPKHCEQIVKDKNGKDTIVTIERMTYSNSYSNILYRVLKDIKAKDLSIDKLLFTEPSYIGVGKLPVTKPGKKDLYNYLTKIGKSYPGMQQALVDALKFVQAFEDGSIKPSNLVFYKIEEKKVAPEENNEMFSTIPLVLAPEEFAETNEIETAKKLALQINADINTRSVKGDEGAKRFVASMINKGVRIKTDASLSANLTDVYKAAVKYYGDTSQNLLSQIEAFTTVSGDIYDISSPELYEHLIQSDNETDLNNLIRLILDCKTFGDNLDLLYSLNVTGENVELSDSLQKLINIINSVKNNTKVNKAHENLFNKYFAKRHSTNPLVQLGLVKLTDIFDDTSWFNLNIGDIADLPHKQIQNVVSYVYDKLNEAKLGIDNHVTTFLEEYERLLAEPGEFREDVVFADGYLGRTFTDEFYDKRQEFIDRVNDARVRYGELSIQYQRARLDRNKWFAKNVEQEYVKEYYDALNENLEKILNAAPDIYIKYLSLNRRITELKSDYTRLTRDQRIEIIQLNKQIKELCDANSVNARYENSVFDDEGNFIESSSNSEIQKEHANKIALQEFRQRQKEINETYFKQSPDTDFEKKLKEKLHIIEEYDKKHSYDHLYTKLENEIYREAYDWVHFNTYYRISNENNELTDNIVKLLEKAISGSNDHISNIIGKQLNNILSKIENPTNIINQTSSILYTINYTKNPTNEQIIAFNDAFDKFTEQFKDDENIEISIEEGYSAVGKYKRIVKLTTIKGNQKISRTPVVNGKLQLDILTDVEKSTLASLFNTVNFINSAFNILNVHDGALPNRQSKTANKQINEIIEKAKEERPGQVIDEYGIFHPENLTKEEIAEIKSITEETYFGKKTSLGSGLENEASAVLIKSIPVDQPVYKQSVYNLFKKKNRTSVLNTEIAKAVVKINNIIKKAVDPITGNISTKLLFENCTEEEIDKLIKYYKQLKEAYIEENDGYDVSYRTRTTAHKYPNSSLFIATKPNMAAYKTERLYYETHLQGNANGAKWIKLFTEDGDINHPNLDMFGYFFVTRGTGSVVNKQESKTLIDEEKTAARDFIRENLEYVETQAYEIAMRRAEADGTFDEWYEANHYYDPFTHTIKPLKIWTEMQIKESSSLAKGTRVQTDTTLNKEIKDDSYRNPNYRENVIIYNDNTGEYSNNVEYTDKELKIINFLHDKLIKYAPNEHTRDFIAKGYLPRRRKAPETDAKWLAKQVIGSVGLQADYQKRDWYDDISYIRDREIDFDMAHLLRGIGYQEYEKLPVHDDSYEVGSPEWEAVERSIKEVKEINKKIRENNAKIDRDLMDGNIKNIFTDYITKSIIIKAKEESKNIIYAMQEDIKNREAYLKSRYSSNLVENKALSTDLNTEYKKIPQKNTLDLFTNWARRFLYDQYKKGSELEVVASFLQNVTSAKYMIFNVTGGIANVLTGLTNMLGETFARDYFDPKDFAEAQALYFANLPSTLSTMYSNKSNSLIPAIFKRFDIVDYEAMVERREGEELHEYADRIQNLLYGLQSGGEHYMQNVVLLSVLLSNKLIKNARGKYEAISYNRYINQIEYKALVEAIKDTPKLVNRLNKERLLLEYDANQRMKYDELREDFVVNFIKNYTRESGSKELMDKYISIRKEMLRTAKEEFSHLPNILSQFELKNGFAVIKDGSNLTEEIMASIKNSVISINKEIHGVYDKIGAAKIEAEWWGSLVMQYHKHLYPGFMKRYRVKGYYNEIKDSFEKGSYASAVKFLGTEYIGIVKRVKDQHDDGEAYVIASMKELIKATVDTVTNLKLNWELLPEWEKNNVRKTYGDLCGIASSMLIAIGLHMATDDDQIKNSNTLSTILYLADRLFSETRLYTPGGLLVETETLMSSPLAATSSVEDLLKAIDIIINISFDENYNPEYTTGLYRGQNKLLVILKQNVPGYRAYNRLQNMSKNNQYYRINDNSRNIKAAKNIANLVIEED